ncbi:gypsy type transposase [Tanacetum coccineum]
MDSNVDEVKRHDDTFSNETHHDEVDIPKFDIEDTTDTDVLRTRPVVDVYESCNSVIEPESYMDSSKNSEWIDAMKAELEMKLVDLSKGKNAIEISLKFPVVDFKDTFALVAHHDTIKLLLAIAAQRNWKSHHLDVKYAFLNGELKEEIYVKQPKGFEVVGQEEKIYRLYKTLYGLKQAPRANGFALLYPNYRSHKGRVVPLLPVAPARGESELEDSVDRLFDEEGNDGQAEQGDSASGGQERRKSVIVDSDEPSYPVKKLRKDHGILVGTSVAGKSMPAIQRLLAGAVQNAAVRGEPVPSLPFVTSYVSTTPEREDEKHTDTLARANLQTVTAPQKFVISSESSHHSGTHIVETKADSLIRSSALAMTTATTVTITAGAAVVVKETVAKPSLFATGSSSVGGTEPIPGGFSDLTGNDFLVGYIRTVIEPDSDLQKVYVSRWNVTNGSRFDDNQDCREIVDEFSPPSSLHLSVEWSMTNSESVEGKGKRNGRPEGTIIDEIRSLKEGNAALEKKKGELDVRVVDLATSVKVREREAATLDTVVATVKLQNDRLIDQDERMKEVKDKFDKLDVDVIEMALHLEERFYPHLLTTIVERRWLLTHGIKLAIAKCLHSSEYLSALRAAISRAIKKGMQDGNYISALQELQDVKFSLLAELKSNKDANIETLMNILRLEEPVAERLGLQESQPHEDQLMIRVNIANDRSALRDVFVSIVEPLSSVTLEGTEGTSGTVPETTTALSVTFAPVSSIPLISMDDYEIAHADDQGNVGADVDPFPNVDDVELIIS